jgi:hypothetical protein
MTPYVPKPQRGSSVSNGFFRKDEFRYDAERDAFICPAGQVLSTRYELEASINGLCSPRWMV